MLIIAMFFGFCEIIGIFIGEQIMIFNPVISHCFCVATILILGTAIKVIEMSQAQLYFLFMIEVFALGAGLNITLIMQDIVI